MRARAGGTARCRLRSQSPRRLEPRSGDTVHPALSVIVFTTASGIGYGLLAWVGLLAPIGALPLERRFGAVSLALAIGFITAGLLSSTIHLGHPERAWRAFSQWRSSWLSREGLAALATYVPALAFAVLWLLEATGIVRSEERRVGKECRSRW